MLFLLVSLTESTKADSALVLFPKWSLEVAQVFLKR